MWCQALSHHASLSANSIPNELGSANANLQTQLKDLPPGRSLPRILPSSIRKRRKGATETGRMSSPLNWNRNAAGSWHVVQDWRNHGRKAGGESQSEQRARKQTWTGRCTRSGRRYQRWRIKIVDVGSVINLMGADFKHHFYHGTHLDCARYPR